MNCQEFRDRLPEYVGNELSAAVRADAQTHLASCGDCRGRARGLQAAAATLESGVIPEAEAARRTEALALPAAARAGMELRPLSLRLPALLRYAAAVALAFGGGYLLRGWQAEPPAAGGSAGAVRVSVEGAVNPRLMQSLASAAQRYPGSPKLSWSLLSLARR